MEHDTNVRCSVCGVGREVYSALEAGWLIASDVLHNEPGRMVIRCEKHIDITALVLAGQEYGRFERRHAETLRSPSEVAITWRGKVVTAFTIVRGGEWRGNDPDFLLGLDEQALRDAGFRKRPRSTGEQALMEVELLLDEE